MEPMTIENIIQDFNKHVYENTLNNLNTLEEQMEKIINLCIVYAAHDYGLPEWENDMILDWLLKCKKKHPLHQGINELII